jgi:hypothetical protein
LDDLGPIEQTSLLLLRQAIHDVLVLQDLVERPSTVVLPDHVLRDPLLACRALEEKREEILERHRRNCILRTVKRRSAPHFAERRLDGVDDQGKEERLVIWIERRPGALWTVGRSVNPQFRQSDEPRPDDIIFEGYELSDALMNANEALEDDVSVLENDRREVDVKPFTRKEVLPFLERWFFGR